MTADASKLTAYVVVASGAAADAEAASKVTPYVVVGPGAAESDVSKLVAYVVTGPPAPNEGILRIKTWTFTLDAHDYYVIQLDAETLVYDFHAERWYVWGSGAENLWGVHLGQNWNANIGFISDSLTGSGMSNVLCGDATNGALYFLDPALAEDDSDEGVPGQAFLRSVTGQIPARGHEYVSCPAVEITGSTGEVVGAADMTVDLLLSDDKGHTYYSTGALTVAEGVFDVTLAWRSLGSFTGPGRLFRITDQGALTRIDGLDVIDGQ